MQVTVTEQDNKIIFNINGVEFTIIQIEGGFFMMGDLFDEGMSDEKPVHEEYVESFGLGNTPVTQELWEAVMGNNPSHFEGENLPVETVSWYDCNEFIQKLNNIMKNAGYSYEFDFPTEAEWEYAARERGRKVRYGNGQDEPVGFNAQLPFGEVINQTSNVFRFPPNALGLHDMSGNVWEWCKDEYKPYEEKVKSESYLSRIAQAKTNNPDAYQLFLKKPY